MIQIHKSIQNIGMVRPVVKGPTRFAGFGLDFLHSVAQGVGLRGKSPSGPTSSDQSGRNAVSEWDLFREDCRAWLLRHLDRAANGADLAAVVVGLQERCENFLATELADGSDRHIACGPGCGSCCAINVAVLLPEAIAIARYLQTHFPVSARRALASRLADLKCAVRWLDDDERILLRRSCAFLDDQGSCSIWPVRPLLCRSITSTDPGACRDALIAPVFGEQRPILMNLRQKELFEAAFRAFGEVLEARGWDHRSLQLTCAVEPLLHRFELSEDFLRGEVLLVS